MGCFDLSRFFFSSDWAILTSKNNNGDELDHFAKDINLCDKEKEKENDLFIFYY